MIYTRTLLLKSMNIVPGCSNEKCVSYYSTLPPKYQIGARNPPKLYDIEKFEKLCGVQYKNGRKKSVNCIFLYDNNDIMIYDLNLTLTGNFCGIEGKDGIPNLTDATFVSLIHMAECLCEHQKVCSSNVIPTINDYSIVEIIENGTKFYDVLLTLPTRNMIHKYYDCMIMIIIIFKRNYVVGDIINDIIKSIIFMNMVESYCDNHCEEKKSTCVKFFSDDVEDKAFKCVVEKLVKKFVYLC